jgi:cytoplasmic iron level regulating protein YaaA (DUF328/UPF0246 family)
MSNAKLVGSYFKAAQKGNLKKIKALLKKVRGAFVLFAGRLN